MDVWKWIAIGDGDKIQSTVVTTRSPVPWFQFLDHVKGRCPFAVGWADNAKLHHMLEIGLIIIKMLISLRWEYLFFLWFRPIPQEWYDIWITFDYMLFCISIKK